MYPFKIILIGNDEELLPNIRRELSNNWAEVEAEFRDSEVAVAQLADHYEEARLFVVHLTNEHDHQVLKQLNLSFPGRPILVLMDEGEGSSNVVNAMRHGASQVVMLPLSIAQFNEALESISLQFGHLASRTRVIAVTGAHGGAGSTSLAVNLAYQMAHHFELETLLLELQINPGVLGSFLQIQPNHTTDELLGMGLDLDLYAVKNAIVPYGERLSIISGPQRAEANFSPTTAAVANLVHLSRHLADVVVLDVPSTMNEQQIETLRTADRVVIVSEQTIPSLNMTMELMNMGARAKSPAVVIGRYDASLEGFDVNHLQDLLDVENLYPLMFDNSGFHAAVNCGKPLCLASPKSKAISDIDNLAEQLLELQACSIHPQAAAGLSGRIAHMFGIS